MHSETMRQDNSTFQLANKYWAQKPELQHLLSKAPSRQFNVMHVFEVQHPSANHLSIWLKSYFNYNYYCVCKVLS